MDDFEILHELKRGEDLLGEPTDERNRETDKVVVLYKPASPIKIGQFGLGGRGCDVEAWG